MVCLLLLAFVRAEGFPYCLLLFHINIHTLLVSIYQPRQKNHKVDDDKGLSLLSLAYIGTVWYEVYISISNGYGLGDDVFLSLLAFLESSPLLSHRTRSFSYITPPTSASRSFRAMVKSVYVFCLIYSCFRRGKGGNCGVGILCLLP